MLEKNLFCRVWKAGWVKKKNNLRKKKKNARQQKRWDVHVNITNNFFWVIKSSPVALIPMNNVKKKRLEHMESMNRSVEVKKFTTINQISTGNAKRPKSISCLYFLNLRSFIVSITPLYICSRHRFSPWQKTLRIAHDIRVL